MPLTTKSHDAVLDDSHNFALGDNTIGLHFVKVDLYKRIELAQNRESIIATTTIDRGCEFQSIKVIAPKNIAETNDNSADKNLAIP